MLQRIRYSPRGESEVQNAGWSTTTDAYVWLNRFQGGRLETRTGIVHFRYRDYATNLGTWMQPEPFGGAYIDGPNLYLPFGNNPVNLTDPLGLSPLRLDVAIEALDTNQTGLPMQITNEMQAESPIRLGLKWLYTGRWDATEEEYEAAVNAAAKHLNCWSRCMADIGAQVGTLAVGAGLGVSPMLPLPKGMLPVRGGLGPKALKDELSSLARLTSVLTRIPQLKQLARAVKNNPAKVAKVGAPIGMIWSEAALSAYCSWKCSTQTCQ